MSKVSLGVMTNARREVAGMIRSVLSDARQIRCIVSDETVGRDGVVLVTAGIDLDEFRRNSVVLAQHDYNRPIARAVSIGAVGVRLEATVQFPPPGVSNDSDLYWRLIQADIVKGISAGFVVRETKPVPGAMKITRSTLLEFSFVSVPAVAGALVTERAARPHSPAMEQTREQARAFMAALRARDAIGGRAREAESDRVAAEWTARQARLAEEQREADQRLRLARWSAFMRGRLL